jgi:hypothetical protein
MSSSSRGTVVRVHARPGLAGNLSVGVLLLLILSEAVVSSVDMLAVISKSLDR